MTESSMYLFIEARCYMGGARGGDPLLLPSNDVLLID